jgi:hypothetical protein
MAGANASHEALGHQDLPNSVMITSHGRKREGHSAIPCALCCTGVLRSTGSLRDVYQPSIASRSTAPSSRRRGGGWRRWWWWGPGPRGFAGRGEQGCHGRGRGRVGTSGESSSLMPALRVDLRPTRPSWLRLRGPGSSASETPHRRAPRSPHPFPRGLARRARPTWRG